MMLNKEAMSKYITSDAVGRQLMEYDFIRKSRELDVEQLASRIAASYALQPFVLLKTCSKPAFAGDVPTDFLIAFFRKYGPESVATKMQLANVGVDRTKVAKWLELHTTEGPTPRNQRKAEALIRCAAVDPDFRLKHVDRENTVTLSGILTALNPIDEMTAIKELTGRVEKRRLPQAEISEANQSRIFYAAWALIRTPKYAVLRKNLTDIVNRGCDYVAGGNVAEYLDEDGVVTEDGATYAVRQVLKQLKKEGVIVDLEISTVEAIAHPITKADLDPEDIRKIDYDKTKDAVRYLYDSGLVTVRDWTQMNEARKAQLFEKLAKLLGAYDRLPAGHPQKKWEFTMRRLRLETPVLGREFAHEVNLPAMRWITERARLMTLAEEVLKERYPSLRSKAQAMEMERWRILLSVADALQMMGETKIYAVDGKIKPRKVIDAYLYSEARNVLSAKYPDEMEKLSEEELDKLLVEMVKILRRANFDSQIQSDGILNPQVIDEAYKQKLSGQSRAEFDEESTDEHDLDDIKGE